MLRKTLLPLHVFLVSGIALLILAGCPSQPNENGTAISSNTQSKTPSSKALFADVASQAGLKFKHQLGDTGRFYIVENTAPGCAFIDYDNDGNLDIFLVQS